MTSGPESAADVAASIASLAAGGLPLEASARLQDLQDSGSWTSDLSVNEFAAIKGVGFDPVGQVMGSTVDYLGAGGSGSCGSSYSSRSAFEPYERSFYAARARAMSRLEQECVALGGDGVVGVHLTMDTFPGTRHALEFQAIGTAIRARGRRHPARPFMTDLSGQEFATLLRAGWMPCGLVFGIAVRVAHDSWSTTSLTRSWQNGEVASYTRLIQTVRSDVRSELAKDIARHGGTTVVLQGMRLRVWEQACKDISSSSDHVAQASLVGTALTPFAHTPRPSTKPLQMMRLDQRHRAVVGTRLSNDTRETL